MAPNEEIFLSFAAWVEKYRLNIAKTGDNKDAALTAEGVRLATERQAALKALIVSNPERALSWATAPSLRALLPPEVTALLETPIAGCGAYNVLAAFIPDPKGGPPRTEIMRYAVVNGKVFKAYTFGRRRGITTKYNISLHGIALGNLLALRDTPVRRLEKDEVPPPGTKSDGEKCPLCDQTAPGAAPLRAQIGNIIYNFDSDEHLQLIEKKLLEKEGAVGPKLGSTCDEPLADLVNEIKKDQARTPAPFEPQVVP